ncbi:hypothetical protein HP550_16315 [Cellulomonas humilata]|uniref:Uncharacterized protein n=1 Tax=Cellulomonas humilata TaxID=144055 RepID=A0A7Y6DYN5_9CELL|nr:hypothetical protein [Cellulomonas humilata]NUU18818.1 hypothetical protein [Cellulomonas humilata]
MTTFDDTDFFTDAFTGFGADQAPRRRSSMLTALVLVAAAALVASGMIWVRLAQIPVALPAVDPATTLAVFDHPQRSVDTVDADDLTGSLIDPASTRFLAATDDTRYYAGVSRTHLLCVLSLTTGELPTTGCTSTDGGVVDLVIGDELLVVNAGGPAPAAADGWHEAGPQVFLKD